MYRTPISNTDVRKILKSIIGIRNTNSLSDLAINDFIYYLEHRYMTAGKLQKHQNRNMYRTVS
jgi:hypothetical protein